MMGTEGEEEDGVGDEGGRDFGGGRGGRRDSDRDRDFDRRDRGRDGRDRDSGRDRDRDRGDWGDRGNRDRDRWNRGDRDRGGRDRGGWGDRDDRDDRRGGRGRGRDDRDGFRGGRGREDRGGFRDRGERDMGKDDDDKPTSIWGDLNDMMKNVMIPPPGAEGNVNEDFGEKVVDLTGSEETSAQDNQAESGSLPNEQLKKTEKEDEPTVIPNGDDKTAESSADGKSEGAESVIAEDKKLDLEEGEIE